MAALDSMWRQPGRLAWGSWRIQFSRWFTHMLESWASSQLRAQLGLWVRELNYSHFLTAGWLASKNKHHRAKWRSTALLWFGLARQIASLLLYSVGQGGHNIPLQIKRKYVNPITRGKDDQSDTVKSKYEGSDWISLENIISHSGPWKREWQTTSVFLPWDPHEQ